MNKFSIIYFLIVIFTSIMYAETNIKVKYLKVGDVVHYEPGQSGTGIFSNDFNIYCYEGMSKSLPKIFQTVILHLDIDSDDYKQYEGPTLEIVKAHHEEQKSIFSFHLLTSKKTKIKLNPFNQTCIGIETLEQYKVRLHLVRVDFWKVSLLASGFFIFWFSRKLSNNPIFYYVTGVLLGICASVMVLIYMLSKLLPRRPLMYGALLGGWAIAAYLIQVLWENIQLILTTYQSLVFWYIVTTGLISFVICYRLGPPRNQRSKNLIRWGLQLIALIMIFFSSQYEEASAAIVLLVFIAYYLPRRWLYKFKAFYVKRFPPKPKLLTNEEYHEQGVRETIKALEELRKYCNSPECKQWYMITKLNDPLRFASFVEGTSHISDQEILEYETSRADSSDSDLSEDEENEINQNQNQNYHDENISEDDDVDDGNVLMHNSSSRNRIVISPNQRLNSSYSRPPLKVIYRRFRDQSDDDN